MKELDFSIDQLRTMPLVQTMVEESRMQAQERRYCLPMPWSEEKAEIYKEGQYPIHTNEGNFFSYLLRVFPQDGAKELFRGGEFRILANERAQEGLFLQEKEPLFILDVYPQFLKELSDERIQYALSEARKEIAKYPGPAFLIQGKSSDIHDGEKRLLPGGQLDIAEEQWYAKVLTTMKLFPGINEWEAKLHLLSIGEDQYMMDFGLGMITAMSYFYPHQKLDFFEQEVLYGKNLLRVFPDDHKDSVSGKTNIAISTEIFKEKITAVTKKDTQIVEVNGQQICVENLASYPIMIHGAELSVQLIATKKIGQRGFRTFRVLQNGDPDAAYIRIDSICSNGVQAGDSHCDCRYQIENELQRAKQNVPMILVSVRDDEGRNHGESQKGATLNLQRRLAAEMGINVGNGIAAQLYYQDTGERVDARSYEEVQAVLKYLGIMKIPYLVTDNNEKIKAVEGVAEVQHIVTAEILEKALTDEAISTREDKKNGMTGVVYHYE